MKIPRDRKSMYTPSLDETNVAQGYALGVLTEKGNRKRRCYSINICKRIVVQIQLHGHPRRSRKRNFMIVGVIRSVSNPDVNALGTMNSPNLKNKFGVTRQIQTDTILLGK